MKRARLTSAEINGTIWWADGRVEAERITEDV